MSDELLQVINGENTMNRITVQEAKENLEQLVEQVVEGVEPAVLCTDAGQCVVLLPLDEFNSWQEALYSPSMPTTAKRLQRSIRETRVTEALDEVYETESSTLDPVLMQIQVASIGGESW